VRVTAIVGPMGVVTALSGVVQVTFIVQNSAIMLGLGVGVDYSLIMIRRFIDEMSSLDRGAALINTMRTAGRTVAASGTTVAAALVTLFIVELPVVVRWRLPQSSSSSSSNPHIINPSPVLYLLVPA
jgi:RND superfamily putative drug exporter